jgi:hypothetical protein
MATKVYAIFDHPTHVVTLSIDDGFSSSSLAAQRQRAQDHLRTRYQRLAADRPAARDL